MTATRPDPSPWRYRCPNGHAAWRRYPQADEGEEYTCKTCEVRFAKEELLDMKEEGVSTADFGRVQ